MEASHHESEALATRMAMRATRCGCTQHKTTWVTAAQATLHCLTGCVIGEVAGLMIGVSLGLGVWPTLALATVLAYISGFTLGLVPVVRREGVTYAEAFRIIWVGEAISIGVMELAMNTVDYLVGGAGSALRVRARCSGSVSRRPYPPATSRPGRSTTGCSAAT